jgi:16S rRNA (adenine1518-N6/adenine1519-N6)-dimethyltransferase
MCCPTGHGGDDGNGSHRERWVSVRGLLAQYGVWPKKNLGQNFMADESVLGKIVAAAQLTPRDVVLEVGAGLGHLTRLLARQAGRIIAVELDDRLMPILRDQLAGCDNVTLVEGDILKLSLSSLLSPLSSDYKVVANLPYYITSAVLQYFLEGEPPPARMVITVQYEVAQRITAQPGDMSLLAVSVQFYGQPRIVTRIKAGAFYPRPEVDSAIVRIERHPMPPMDVPDVRAFFAVVKAGFAQRRKQLRNSLSAGLRRPQAEVAAALEAADVDPRRRPETLSLEEWAAITCQLTSED